MGHIKRDELTKAEVLIPSKKDYDRIGALLEPIYTLMVSKRLESVHLATIRDSLMPKLISGEIDVSDVQF